MDRLERITAMEQLMDEAAAALSALDASLTAYEAARPALQQLADYYDGDWRGDFAADEAGELPKDMKRGVLSEDGLWNLLEDARSIEARMAELSKEAAPLTPNEYQHLALRTLNPALTEKDVLINGVMGLCGEAGEAIDLVKKHLAQGHALDRTQLAKELGDVAWYLAETAYAIGYDLETVLRGNIDKLRARYPEGFDADRSQHRKTDDE